MYLSFSNQLLLSLAIEGALILVTLLFLVQPESLIRFRSDRGKAAARIWGLVLLCITFCWSVVLGCVYAIQSITMRL